MAIATNGRAAEGERERERDRDAQRVCVRDVKSSVSEETNGKGLRESETFHKGMVRIHVILHRLNDHGNYFMLLGVQSSISKATEREESFKIDENHKKRMKEPRLRAH